MYERIKRGWAESSSALSGTPAFWNRSAAGSALLRDLRRVIAAHARGRLLDAGAGTLTYRSVLQPYVQEYRSIDLRRTHPDLDYLGDVQRMPIPDGRFDAVFCTEVLEHVPDPAQALREMRRVLRRGGKLILSAPHLGYLHNEPDDYYRYTKYGLRTLLERAGFRVVLLEPSAGFFSFLQHVLATAAVGLAYGRPLLWPGVYAVCRVTGALAVWLDGHTDRRKVFALHYVAVAEA